MKQDIVDVLEKKKKNVLGQVGGERGTRLVRSHQFEADRPQRLVTAFCCFGNMTKMNVPTCFVSFQFLCTSYQIDGNFAPLCPVLSLTPATTPDTPPLTSISCFYSD